MTLEPLAAPPSHRRAPPPGPEQWTGQWLFAAVFSAALLVRTAYCLSIRHAYFFGHLQTEPARYDAWALAFSGGAAPAPLDEPPAYPLLVSLIYAAAGHRPFAVTSFQALLDSASCTLIALVALRTGGPRAGVASGVAATLYGPMVYFVGQIEPATLAVFAVSLALAATPSGGPGSRASSSSTRWTLAGAAWAAASLVRAEMLVALLPVLLHAGRTGGRGALARAAAPAVALLALSCSVTWASTGHLAAAPPGAGVNLWIGNNDRADGVSPFLDAPLGAEARAIEARARDAFEADRLFLDRALSFIAGEPARAGRLALRKLVWVWTSRELPNAADIDWQTAQSWLFRLRPVPLFGLGALLPVAAAGAALLGRDWRRGLPLLGPVLVAVAVSVVFFTNARFRIPFVPSLLVLAGIGIDRSVAAARARDARRLTRGALAAALGALAAWNDFDGVRAFRIPEVDMNTAALEVGAGELEAAVARLRLALARRPDDATGWAQLAATLERAGRLDEARYARARARGIVSPTETPSEAGRAP